MVHNQQSSKLRSPNLKSPSSRLPAVGSSSATPDPSQNLSTPRIRHAQVPYRSPASQTASRSNIPRPNLSAESGSEVEGEYNRRHAAGRLVVANAEVIPSSSESEHDRARRHRMSSVVRSNEGRRREKTSEWVEDSPKYPETRQGQYGQPSSSQRGHNREEKNSVGLGFRFESERVARERPYEDTVAAYTDEDSEVQDDGRYEDNYQARSIHREERGVVREDSSCRRSLGLSDPRRRREALMGLVNGLQLEYDTDSADKGRNLRDYDEVDHRYSTGVVVTESMEMEYDENYFDSAETYSSRDTRRRSRDDREISRNDSSKRSRREGYIPVEINARSRRDSGRSGSYSQKDKGGSTNRSSSVPPGPRSGSRTKDSPETERRRPVGDDRIPEIAHVSRQTKSRHRVSMSVDQSSSLSHPATPSASRSKRASGNLREDISASRPVDYRRDTAAREREAFGIPASLSYGAADERDTSELRRGSRRILSRTGSDSELSTAGGDEHASPEINPDGLSRAAEALFDKLAGQNPPRVDRQHSERRNGRRRQSLNEAQIPPREQPRVRSNQRPAHRAASISPSCSAPSVYEQEHDNAEDQHHSSPQAAESWCSSLRPRVFERLLSLHGAVEMQRQEVLFKYYRSQRQLVSHLRSTVKAFILPLRRKHSKSWIPGIPTQATRLFDWLEDIVNLHVAIAEALEPASVSWESGNIAVNVAKALRGFVPRLEVYQPYLMRFEEVRQLITERVDSASDDFAEYVRIREQRGDCDGWTLAELLYQPVQHLSVSVNTFEVSSELRRLCQRSHSLSSTSGSSRLENILSISPRSRSITPRE